MRVTERPVRNQRRLLIRNIVAIGVFQIDRLGAVLHDGSASDDHNRRRNAQPLGKHRKLIRDMVAVCVFTDSNAVAIAAEFVRIVNSFANPQSPSFVPCHRDGLCLKMPFIGVKSNGHPLWSHKVFDGLLSGQRLLHERARFPLNTPFLPRRVVGNFRSDIDVLELRNIFPLRRHVRSSKRVRITE